VSESSSGDAAWDLAALMRILQPPRRVVTADGNRALVAVVGGPRSSSGVRVFEQEGRGGGGSDRWLERARFERVDAESNDEFGAALALVGDVALVGAPKHGESGAVYVFVRDPESGEWRQEARIPGADVPANAGFGTAVVFDGDVALIMNTPSGKGARTDEGRIRAAAVQAGVSSITTIQAAEAVVMAMEALREEELNVLSLQDRFKLAQRPADFRVGR